MSDHKITLKIRGQEWTVKLYTTEGFYKQYEEAVAAVTIPNAKEIIFNDDDLSLATVIHELTHAYFAASHVVSANLSADQVEEVMCELIGELGPEIVRVGRKLSAHLKKAAKDL
jgi:hypothetical protein